MAFDLKWRDALVAVGLDDRDRSPVWPRHLNISELALFQRPVDLRRLRVPNGLDVLKTPEFARIHALKGALTVACKEGSLVSEWFSTVGGEVFGVGRGVHLIKPQDFADWLHQQGEEPSVHIANWFKVFGVKAGADVLSLHEVSDGQPTAAPSVNAAAARKRKKTNEEALKANLEAKGLDVAWLRTKRGHWTGSLKQGGTPKLLVELRTLGIDVPGADPVRVINRLLKAEETLAASWVAPLINSSGKSRKRGS